MSAAERVLWITMLIAFMWFHQHEIDKISTRAHKIIEDLKEQLRRMQ